MLFDQFHFIDLTHRLNSHVPTWSGSCGFCLEIKKDYDKVFKVQQIKMHAGAGTHMDAPSHRFKEGHSIADIPLDHLFVEACKIDVSEAHPDYEICVEDIKKYENSYGEIPPKSLVIGYTGWDRFWSAPKAYRNEDSNGQMHFPAFSQEACEVLLKRDVAGIAIDTLSPDCSDQNYPVHKMLLGEGKYIIENIANGAKLPVKGSHVIALPISLEDATESPIRIVGLVRK